MRSAKTSQRDAAFRRIIRSVPRGKVSTYGKVAAAAGYPLYHRAVAKLLRSATIHGLPWQRIVGAGGEIKLKRRSRSRTASSPQHRGRKVSRQTRQHGNLRALPPQLGDIRLTASPSAPTCPLKTTFVAIQPSNFQRLEGNMAYDINRGPQSASEDTSNANSSSVISTHIGKNAVQIDLEALRHLIDTVRAQLSS